MSLTTLSLLFLAALWSAPDAPTERFYYVGEVVTSDADGAPTGSQVILLEKIHDPDASTLTERAIVVRPTGEAEEQTVVFAVAADGSFTVSDAAGMTEGEGQLHGAPWAWTYFEATYRHRSGVTIEDENTMNDPSVVTARKVLRMPDGSVFMHMDVTLKAVTPATFEILAAGLLGD